MADYITWDGTDLRTLGVVLGNFSDVPPKRKRTVVSVPQGADVDATDCVAYSNRVQTWTLRMVGNDSRNATQKAVDKLLSVLDGGKRTFSLSWDEGATYTGSATVTGVEYIGDGSACTVTAEVDCSPWRDMGTDTVTANAKGGATMAFSGPKKPAVPSITADSKTLVVLNGVSVVAKAGTRTYMGLSVVEGNNTLLAVSMDSESNTVDDVGEYFVLSEKVNPAWKLCYDYRTKAPAENVTLTYARKEI